EERARVTDPDVVERELHHLDVRPARLLGMADESGLRKHRDRLEPGDGPGDEREVPDRLGRGCVGPGLLSRPGHEAARVRLPVGRQAKLAHSPPPRKKSTITIAPTIAAATATRFSARSTVDAVEPGLLRLPAQWEGSTR